MPLHRYDLTKEEYSSNPRLNRELPEDFSFGGKIVKASRLGGYPSWGKAIGTFAGLPVSNVLALCWSPSGRLLTIGHTSGAVTLYSFTGNDFVYITPPPVATGPVRDMNWSRDGKALAVAHDTSPYIMVYNVTYTSPSIPFYAPADDPLDPLPGNCRAVSFSPDGMYLACATHASPYVNVYYFTGGAFITKLDDPAILPAGIAEDISWSPDGRYLAVGHADAPYITVYYFDGSSFTKIPDPASLPSFDCAGVAWSPDGRFLSVCGNDAPRMETYEFSNGNIGDKLPTPAVVIPQIALDLEWTSDGRALLVSYVLPPYVAAYNFDGVKLENNLYPGTALSPDPAGRANMITSSPDGKYIAVGGEGTPGVIVYSNAVGSVSGGAIVELAPISNIP